MDDNGSPGAGGANPKVAVDAATAATMRAKQMLPLLFAMKHVTILL
jgi:hypothetical protein